MTVWEYLEVPMESGQTGTMERTCNVYGKEGWELVQIVARGIHQLPIAMFKRSFESDED